MASRPAFAEIRKGMSGSIGVPHDVLIRHAHESIEEQRWRREDRVGRLCNVRGEIGIVDRNSIGIADKRSGLCDGLRGRADRIPIGKNMNTIRSGQCCPASNGELNEIIGRILARNLDVGTGIRIGEDESGNLGSCLESRRQFRNRSMQVDALRV